jgi:multidrug efflux pump subunit AcrB
MENQTEGFGTLGIALLAAIVLVYLVMVSLYDSFVYPFVVLFSIPLAMIGVMVILAINRKFTEHLYDVGDDHVDWFGSEKCDYDC